MEMNLAIHPNGALFDGEPRLPTLPACEHFAGSQKLIEKAFALQAEYGPVFDITCDCEDGATSGQEPAHASLLGKLIASSANPFQMAGARVHDPDHAHCLADIDILLEHAGDRIAYLTIPKTTSADKIERVIEHVVARSIKLGLKRTIPIHALIETHGALADVARIAALPGIQVLDFGLMDFVSAHHGAIPASAMHSPGQFEHRLLSRAKAEVVAAALANGVVPAHNVCLNLKDSAHVLSDATRARQEFGFLRMWSIHPAQIRPILQAFQPSYEEIELASEILVSAQKAQWGPIQFRGELHDRATYRYYWYLLQRAHNVGVLVPPAALAAFFRDAAA